ncbi:MAG: hypothetical protein KY464_11620, partial [Gemmatimonadetes bacterium]|nr:hypothetical protein [Gemmatimonadota bacterium]
MENRTSAVVYQGPSGDALHCRAHYHPVAVGAIFAARRTFIDAHHGSGPSLRIDHIRNFCIV